MPDSRPLAFVRPIAASFAHALSATPPEPPIDLALARAQHAAYCAALVAAGADVVTVPTDDASPDCCFIEDTAVVAAGLAVITRPGAPSRRAEPAAVAAALAEHVELVQLTAPATLDGGDCLLLGDTIYVGRSARTNPDGIAQLARAFAPRGIRVVALDLPPDVLHLKCVCAPLGGDRVLLADDTIPASAFARAEIVRIPAGESYAANAVAIGAHVLAASGFPRTHEALARAGFTVHPMDASEARKADGSLTCQSIIVPRPLPDRLPPSPA